MEDAHALPDASRTALSQYRRPSRSSITSPSIAPSARQNLASNRQQDGVSPQTRRLTLRNAGFRGPILPGRRISPIFGAISQASEPASHVTQEHYPGATERRILYGEDLPPSPVNILQEISNSTYRQRNIPRRSLCADWQDSAATENIPEGSLQSWYNETSNTTTPLVKLGSPDNMMKLREESLSEKTSPTLNSPLTRHVKGRRERKSDLRSSSYEASKYIEHLESQLAAANTRIEALTSPTTTKMQSAKLRAISADCRSLQQEVSEWETKFAERVKDEVDQRLETETGSNTRIRSLEQDVEVKDGRIQELQWEVESLLQRAKNSEALEMINFNLEKRVDVLTELLAQSPIKLESCSTTTSPSEGDPSKRTPRPRSMMPRLPSSPGGVRLSLPTVTATGVWHSRNSGSNEDVSGSSLDPTTSFLSQPDHSSPYSTPTQPPRGRSATWAQAQTLNALEGRPSSYPGQLSQHVTDPSPSPTLYLAKSAEDLIEDDSEHRLVNDLEERSLMVELARADEVDECQPEDEQNYENASNGVSEMVLVGIEEIPSNQLLCNSTPRRRRPPAEAELTPKGYWKRISIAAPPTKSVVPAETFLPNGFNILARLARPMSYGTMDPLALARRILRVAWISGSSIFRGIGWWLLGLLFRSRKRKKKPTADRTIVEESAPDDFEWHQYTAEESRARRVEQYWQDEGIDLRPPSAIAPNGPNIPFEGPSEPLPSSDNERAFNMTRDPDPFRCKDCVMSASRHTLRLWFHFSLAIVLAVGVAVKDGPGVLLGDPHPEPPRPPDEANFRVEAHSNDKR
ncbi:hypothetical protein MMC08_001961 [Hypocenomyce scalaris]|nr:hypothetical protein [Hypocenomyce scalaris]